MNRRPLYLSCMVLALSACGSMGVRHDQRYQHDYDDRRGRTYDSRYDTYPDNGHDRRDRRIESSWFDSGANYQPRATYYSEAAGRSDACDSCGVIVLIERYRADARQTSGGGAVVGAVIGGVLGSQIGSGSGRTAATVAGAFAGGMAGNAMERDQANGDYLIRVRLDSGDEVQIRQARLDGLREGVRVWIDDGRVRLD